MKMWLYSLLFCSFTVQAQQREKIILTPEPRFPDLPPANPLPPAPVLPENELLSPRELKDFMEMPSLEIELPTLFPANPSWIMKQVTLHRMANDTAAWKYEKDLANAFRNLQNIDVKSGIFQRAGSFTFQTVYRKEWIDGMPQIVPSVKIDWEGFSKKKKRRAARTRQIIESLNNLP